MNKSFSTFALAGLVGVLAGCGSSAEADPDSSGDESELIASGSPAAGATRLAPTRTEIATRLSGITAMGALKTERVLVRAYAEAQRVVLVVASQASPDTGFVGNAFSLDVGGITKLEIPPVRNDRVTIGATRATGERVTFEIPVADLGAQPMPVMVDGAQRDLDAAGELTAYAAIKSAAIADDASLDVRAYGVGEVTGTAVQPYLAVGRKGRTPNVFALANVKSAPLKSIERAELDAARRVVTIRATEQNGKPVTLSAAYADGLDSLELTQRP